MVVAAAPGGFRLERDVKGVEGLVIAHNVFGEELERRLFEMGCPGRGGRRFMLELSSFGPDIFRVLNAVCDIGMLPGFQIPDSGHMLSYCTPSTPSLDPSALPGIHPHYDEESMFGETVLGISLGTSSLLTMMPDAQHFPGKLPVRKILLPRRSIYILSGRARYSPGWQHGIESIGVGMEPRPPWNPRSLRRSITLRSTMPYALVSLEEELRACPPREGHRRAWLQQRLARLRQRGSANRQSPRLPGLKVDVREVRRILSSPLAQTRMRARDALFLSSLPREVAALYPGVSPSLLAAAPAAAGGAAGPPREELRVRRLAALGHLEGRPPGGPPGGQGLRASRGQGGGGAPGQGRSQGRATGSGVLSPQEQEEEDLRRALWLSLQGARWGAAPAASAAQAGSGRASSAPLEVVDLTGSQDEQPAQPTLAAGGTKCAACSAAAGGAPRSTPLPDKRQRTNSAGGDRLAEVISLLSDDDEP
eukprot:scaffold1.g5697.t1